MLNLFPILSFLVSAILAFLAMPWLLRFCKNRGLYDMPNERKVHHNKIPRLGGVLFMPCAMAGVGASIVVMMLMDSNVPNLTMATLLILIGIFLIYLIGLLDDLFGLSAKIKFLVQFVSSLFLPLCNLYFNNLYGFMGIEEISMWLSYPLTIFVSLLIVNSINLIDGIDGLASGLSIIALSAFTFIFYELGVTSYAMFSMGLLGVVVVFFYFNMFGSVEKCTKTFMGDTGSLILGYSLSYLSIKLAMDNDAVLPGKPEGLLCGFTLLLVPTLDLIRVALLRLKHGVSIFHPDKTHMHHKLLNAGFSMHQSLVFILLLQLGFCVLNALLYYWTECLTGIVVIDLVVFVAVQLWISHRMAARNGALSQVS